MIDTPRDDLVWWAVGASVPIPSRYRIGPDRCARVLAVLALHANVDGHAWPSADTIAATIPGLHRRDVRDALAVLEHGGFISRVTDSQVKRRSVTCTSSARAKIAISCTLIRRRVPSPSSAANADRFVGSPSSVHRSASHCTDTPRRSR